MNTGLVKVQLRKFRADRPDVAVSSYAGAGLPVGIVHPGQTVVVTVDKAAQLKRDFPNNWDFLEDAAEVEPLPVGPQILPIEADDDEPAAPSGAAVRQPSRRRKVTG